MAMSNEKVAEVINDVIETVQDGVDGYRRAAQDARSSDLKTLFQNFADQRVRFKNELQDLVTQFGGRPETRGSTAAQLHRGWIDLKSTLTGRDDESILEECKNGDEVALNVYQRKLNEHTDLPSNVYSVLQSQHTSIQEACNRVRLLEKARG